MKFNCAFLPGLLKEIGLWLVRLLISLAILLCAFALVWITGYCVLLLIPTPYGVDLAKKITFFNFAALSFVARLSLVVISGGMFNIGFGLYIRIFWIWKKIVRLFGDGKINSQDSINYLLLLKRLLLYQLWLEPMNYLSMYIISWPKINWIRDLSVSVVYYAGSLALYTWAARRIRRKLQQLAAQN